MRTAASASPLLLVLSAFLGTAVVLLLRGTAPSPKEPTTAFLALSPQSPSVPPTILNGSFPAGFIFGVSTSAYQIEGGWLDGGKGLSVWDALSHTPGRIANGDTGDVADDHYHMFLKDVELMALHGIKHYRLSISWPRILPQGQGAVNPEGVAFYNQLIDTLLQHDITPYVTLFHSDMPLALTMYPRVSNPFLSDDFPALFADYADVAFREFGDRVKVWLTFNEPWCSAVLGVPGPTHPYLIAHNILRAHARAAQLYRNNYQTQQGGQVGLVLNSAHYFPKNPSDPGDVSAAGRASDFNLGWFLHPLIFGDYPPSMRQTVGDRLPQFTADEAASLRGSLDVLGINYYMAFLASPGLVNSSAPLSYFGDERVSATLDPSWPVSQTGWGVCATGLRELLLLLRRRYGPIPTLITENGIALQEDDFNSAVQDVARQTYLHDHIEAIGQARDRGADNVNGYFVWSLLDNLEWSSGYAMKFGLAMVQRPSLQRIPKHSMLWYRLLMAAHKITADQQAQEQQQQEQAAADSEKKEEEEKRGRAAGDADGPTNTDGPINADPTAKAEPAAAAQTHAHWHTPAEKETEKEKEKGGQEGRRRERRLSGRLRTPHFF